MCVVVSGARKPFVDGKFGGKNRAATAEVSGFCAPTHQDTVCKCCVLVSLNEGEFVLMGRPSVDLSPKDVLF